MFEKLLLNRLCLMAALANKKLLWGGDPFSHKKIKDIFMITTVILIFPAKIITCIQFFDIKNI